MRISRAVAPSAVTTTRSYSWWILLSSPIAGTFFPCGRHLADGEASPSGRQVHAEPPQPSCPTQRSRSLQHERTRLELSVVVGPSAALVVRRQSRGPDRRIGARCRDTISAGLGAHIVRPVPRWRLRRCPGRPRLPRGRARTGSSAAWGTARTTGVGYLISIGFRCSPRSAFNRGLGAAALVLAAVAVFEPALAAGLYHARGMGGMQ